jgi:hypothetical protein
VDELARIGDALSARNTGADDEELRGPAGAARAAVAEGLVGECEEEGGGVLGLVQHHQVKRR